MLQAHLGEYKIGHHDLYSSASLIAKDVNLQVQVRGIVTVWKTWGWKPGFLALDTLVGLLGQVLSLPGPIPSAKQWVLSDIRVPFLPCSPTP